MRRRWSSLAAAGALLSACIGAHPSQVSPRDPVGVSVLGAAEIAAANVGTAYEALARLRPQFLRSTRGPEDPLHGLVVYLDGIPVGGVEELRRIPASEVMQIRCLTAWKAAELYGNSRGVGALDVRTNQGPR